MLSKHFDKETPVRRAVATSQKTVETYLNGGHNLPPDWNRVNIPAKKLCRRVSSVPPECDNSYDERYLLK